MRRISTFLLVCMLVFQLIPQSILAQSIDINENGETVVLSTDQADQMIKLYADKVGQEIDTMIPNNITVLLLEIDEYFSLIKYIKTEGNDYEEILEGYVHNKDIIGLEDTLTYQSEPSRMIELEMSSENHDKDVVGSEENIEVQSEEDPGNQINQLEDNYSPMLNLDKSDIGTVSTLLVGYAQMNSTTVYESTSKESQGLKSYEIGSQLKYYPHSKGWYRTEQASISMGKNKLDIFM